MASPSRSIDYWRKFFWCTGSDIFEVIEQAILVAASDHPEEFQSRRDQIGEKLYTTMLRRRSDHCSRVELQAAEREEGRGCVAKVGEESKVEPSNNPVVLSNNTGDEAEALTGDMGVIEEEKDQNDGEILRIKEILHNKDEESDDVLLESLRRLQQMEMTVDVLKATEIGKALNGLRKYKSKQICQLACTIIKGWKALVDEWISANAAITTDTQNPSPMNDERGLPSPPSDEGGAPLDFQTSSVLLSQNSDGMDYEGNLRSIEEFDNSQKSERRPREKDETGERSSTSVRPATYLANEQKVGNEAKAEPSQRKPLAVIQDGSKDANESSIKARLEIAKRKLHKSYGQAENVKKQRRIQIMELPDIPKQTGSIRSTLKIKIRSKLQSNGK